jgi:hypothetical protein
MIFRWAQKDDFYRIVIGETPELMILRKRLYDPGMTERVEQWTRTMEHEGEILAIYGANPLWDGVVNTWAFLSSEALLHPVALTRDVIRSLKILEGRGVRRIQSDVEDGHIAAHRWHQFMGFEVEGYMKNYGLGGVGDFYLYARCSDG